MDKTIVNFKAEGQKLTVEEPRDFAIHTVNYIEAHFELGSNWDGFDSVRAIWTNKVDTIATVLTREGVCVVPWEVLKERYPVRVNLVGSIVADEVLTDRLTTEQIVAFNLPKNALISGTETADITPSQYEQFVANIREEADRAEQARDDAEAYVDSTKAEMEEYVDTTKSAMEDYVDTTRASLEEYVDNTKEEAEGYVAEALDTIEKAEIASAKAGYMFFHIDENGHLIYERTPNTQVDFYLLNGDLYVEAIDE